MGRLLDTNKEGSKEIKPVASTGRLLNANQNKEVSSDITPTVDKAVEKIVGKPDKNLFQRMKDGYMNVSNKAADIFEELPLGLYSGGASIPSGLLSSVQSLKSLTKNAAESKLKGGIGYKIASKLFPQIGEITDKGISAVDKVTGFQDTILNTAKEFTDTKLSKPAAVNVEKYHTKTGDISSKPERFIEGLGYTLASMAPAFATAGAGASPAASAFVGGLIEAGQNTDQLANEIDSRTDLTAQQKQNRKDTMFVSSLLTSTLADRFGIFGESKSLFKRLINTELTEIPEEVGTQFMQNLLSDKPLTEGLGETALFTALMAPVLGGLGHSVQPTSEEEIIKSLDKNQAFKEMTDEEKQSTVNTIMKMQDSIVTDNSIEDIASQFTDAYDQQFAEDKSLLKPEKKVDEALFQEKPIEADKDLIEEAKKYKSADEFVKAQPKLFHGGTADIKDVNLGKSNFQKTFYMSDNADYAKSYGGNKSVLNEMTLSPQAKMADLRNPTPSLVKEVEAIISSKPTGKMVSIKRPDGSILEIPEVKGGMQNPVHDTRDIIKGIKEGKAYFAELPEVKQSLKKLDYDGMITQESKYGANYGVWNKDVLKTKSQLTDIWNKSNQPSFQEKKNTKETSYEKGLEKLKNYEKQYGIQFTKKVFDKLFTGKYDPDGLAGQAYGMYLGGRITLAELITETTADHEMVHFVLDNIDDIPVFKGFSKNQVLQMASNQWMDGKKVSEMTKPELRMVEEYLAEGYEEFVTKQQSKKPQSFSKRLQDFFQKVLDTFTGFFNMSPSEAQSVEKFYDRMYFSKSPKGQDIITIYDTSASSSFMEARYEEFGKSKEIVDQPMFQETNNDIQEEYDKVLVDENKNKQKKNYVYGKKVGSATEKNKSSIKIENLTRSKELERLRENITRRLYTRIVLDTLRKNIPRKEWGTFMTRLSKIGTSGVQYSNLLKSIYERSSEIAAEKGENFVKAKVRSRIGYLKKIFDVQPSLILSIKKDLGYTKSIKNLGLEQLETFIDELRKRIDFQVENKPSYFKTNFLPVEKGFFGRFLAGLKNTDKKIIAPVERAAKKISNAFNESLMTVFFEQNRKIKTYGQQTTPLMDIYEKASEPDKELIKQYAQSSQEPQMRAVLEQYATPDEVNSALNGARSVLDEIHKELKEVGVNVPYRGFYFPRKLKKLDANQAEAAIKAFEYKQGKIATGEEKQEILNALMRGIDVTRLPFVTLSGKKFETARLIETIDSELSPLYEDFDVALSNYIGGAIEVIETRRYFGKTLIDNPDYMTMLDQSIGAKTYKMLEDGLITEKDVTEMKWVLNQAFVEKSSPMLSSIQKMVNNFIYPLALGQITSTWNQTKDLAQTILVNDIFAGKLNTIGKITVKNDDIYLNEDWMALEGSNKNDKSKVAQLLEKTLVPFGKADEFWLKVFINGANRRLLNLAKNNNTALSKQLVDIFGEEKGKKVMQDFAQTESTSKISDDMARVIFSEIARVRPITRLQKTSGAIKAPLFYVLKNFTVKQLQFVRSESLDIIANGIRTKDTKEIARGSGRLIAIAAVIGLLGAGVDELKDWLLGKNQDDSFFDRITNNLLSIIAFSRYNIDMISETGIGEQLFNAYILPSPVSIIKDILKNAEKDVNNVLDGESVADIKTIRKFPLIGELYYQKIGGGSKSEIESTIERSISTTKTKLEKIDPELVKTVQPLYDEQKKADFKNESVALAKMTSQQKEVYKIIKSVDDTKALLKSADKLEKLVDENSEIGFGSPEEKENLKDLSPSELEYYKEIKKKKFPLITGFTQAREKAKRSLVDYVVDYAKAYGTDPSNAFKAMFTKETLGDVEGNLVQLNRMGSDIPAVIEQVSQEKKKEMMEKAGLKWTDRGDYKLEHIVPVGIGGQSVTGNNLEIISNSDHDKYTPFDTKLSKSVRSGKMTRKEAEKLARQLKVAKTITVEESLNMIK